jgi:hypothetical protein
MSCLDVSDASDGCGWEMKGFLYFNLYGCWVDRIVNKRISYCCYWFLFLLGDKILSQLFFTGCPVVSPHSGQNC